MSESLGARAVRAGWNYETCGWQSGLSLSLSPYEAYLIIITMILSSFAEHIYSALVARANCGVSSPSPCQYLLSLLWKRRGWPRLSTEGGGERQRSTESFIFLIHLRAFPRLASSGQHKPVLPSHSSRRRLGCTCKVLVSLQGGGWLLRTAELSLQ